jgi:hypothetical protein
MAHSRVRVVLPSCEGERAVRVRPKAPEAPIRGGRRCRAEILGKKIRHT